KNHHPRGCGVALEVVSHCPGLQGSSPELLRNNVGLGLVVFGFTKVKSLYLSFSVLPAGGGLRSLQPWESSCLFSPLTSLPRPSRKSRWHAARVLPGPSYRGPNSAA